MDSKEKASVDARMGGGRLFLKYERKESNGKRFRSIRMSGSLLEEVKKELASRGAETKILSADRELASMFRAYIPTGSRAVFLYSQEGKRSVTEYLLRSLESFLPICVSVQGGDWASIFSLPDDIRVAVGYGSEAIFAARFFATVRGCMSVAVPSSPSAEGCFEKQAPDPFAGYPLEYPDFVIADGNCMRHQFGQTLAETSLAALCAEELRTDALFSGNRYDISALERVAEAVREAGTENDPSLEKLFFASALYKLIRDGFPDFACCGMVSFLNRRMPQNKSKSAYAVLRYCVQRYVSFCKGARPRPFYIPDYAGRMRRAAEEAEIPPDVVFKNVTVPHAEESFARVRIFLESRRKMCVSAALLSDFVQKVARGYYIAEQSVLPLFPLSEAYDLSAELTPLLSVPVLEREFGLLCREEKRCASGV